MTLVRVPCPRCREHHATHRVDPTDIVLDFDRTSRRLHAGYQNSCTGRWEVVDAPHGVWAELVEVVGRVYLHDRPAEVDERPSGPPLREQDVYVFSTLLELVREGFGDATRFDILKLLEAYR